MDTTFYSWSFKLRNRGGCLSNHCVTLPHMSIRVGHVRDGKAGMSVWKVAKSGNAKIAKNHVFADSVVKKRFGKNVAARKRGKPGDDGSGGGIVIIDFHK